MKLINHINTQLLHRRIVLVLFDIMTACVAGVIPLWIRFELNFNDIPNVYLESVWNFMLINVVITLIVFYMFRLYHSLWAFAGTAEAQNIVAACFLCAVLNFLGMNLLKYPIPRSYYFMYALVLTGIITLGRFSYRIVRGRVHKSQNKKKGAGLSAAGIKSWNMRHCTGLMRLLLQYHLQTVLQCGQLWKSARKQAVNCGHCQVFISW